MFDGDSKRRLSAIENHLTKQDEQRATSMVVETRLSEGLKALSEDLRDFTEKESKLMREHTAKEELAAKEHLVVISKISVDIEGIKLQQNNQPKDFALAISKEKATNLATFVAKAHLKWLWGAIGLLILSAVSGTSLMDLIKAAL